MRKRLFLLLIFISIIMLAACNKTNKMVGTYKMTGYKVGGEEQATKDIIKIYDKHDIPFGVLTVGEDNKAKIHFTEADEDWNCKFDEEYFIDDEDNSFEYTFDETDGSISLSGKKDGEKIKMSFEKISDEVEKISKLIDDNDLEKVLKSVSVKRFEGSFKVVRALEDGRDSYAEYGYDSFFGELEKKGVYYGLTIEKDDKTAVMKPSNDYYQSITYDDKYFYFNRSSTIEKYEYVLDGENLTLTSIDPPENIVYFKKMTDSEAKQFAAQSEDDFYRCYNELTGYYSSWYEEPSDYYVETTPTQALTPTPTADVTKVPTPAVTQDWRNTQDILTNANVTLTLWDIAVEGDGNRPAYDAAMADLKVKYPNITIIETVTENEAYKTKIKSAVATNELPDIFFTWSGAFLGDFVETGRVHRMDDALQKYIDNGELNEAMLGNSTYNGKHYGTPTTMNVVCLFANMDILTSVGYSYIPTTKAELFDCCDKLLAKGIIPFGCSGKETWCVTEYLEPIIEKTIGASALNDIYRNKASWYNSDVADSVNLLQEMIAKGYFDPDGSNMGNEEVKSYFMSGKYAFYQNGSWNCGDFMNSERVKFNVAIGEFPVIDSSRSRLGQFIGGPSDTLAVSEGPNAEVAAAYAVELSRLICHYGYLLGSGLPTWETFGDTSEVRPLVKSLTNLCKDANGFALFGDNAMPTNDAYIYLDYVSEIYNGEIDGDTFIYSLYCEIG